MSNAIYRIDGLNNPSSPNCRSIGWSDVEQLADQASAVESYDYEGREIVITWCDGTTSRIGDPMQAYNEITAMDNAS